MGAIVGEGIVDNIERQQQADGRALKRNARSTMERKRRLGRALLSLIDKQRRFVKKRGRSWKVLGFTKTSVEVGPATQELSRLSKFVQKKGYTGWLGSSARTQKKQLKIIRAELKRIFDRARR